MDERLQQAVVATRAGDKRAAQLLLVDSLQQNPQDANAWFLLAHLVEPVGRQARYLAYALALQPDHALAAEHLGRLTNPVVSPPVIKEARNSRPAPAQATPAPTVESVFSPIPPARTNAASTVAGSAEPATPGYQMTVQPGASRPPSKSIDTEWTRTAGSPKRVTGDPVVRPRTEKIAAPVVAAPVVVPAPVADNEKKQPVSKWLLAVLIIMIALAFFLLSFLAYTIFFQ